MVIYLNFTYSQLSQNQHHWNEKSLNQMNWKFFTCMDVKVTFFRRSTSAFENLLIRATNIVQQCVNTYTAPPILLISLGLKSGLHLQFLTLNLLYFSTYYFMLFSRPVQFCVYEMSFARTQKGASSLKRETAT